MLSGLNICTGIDAGSSCSKLAYADNLGTRIIARSDGFDPLDLREQAEIFFDEIILSCVIAIPDGLPSRKKDNIILQAEKSGFRDVHTITTHEAMCLGLGDEARTVACDFGASSCRVAVIEGGSILDSAIIADVCGDEFDRSFAEYLRERRRMKKVDAELLREAKRLKHILSENDSRLWHNMTISREDFTRLAHFPVKRAYHTVSRLLRVWQPERFILTGGCAKIPAVREIFGGAEIVEDVIARGAAAEALSLTKQETRKNVTDTATRMREIRAEILRVEEKLTRAQKDRLYILFRQAEGINDAGIITLMENLIREIRNA